MLLLVEVAAGSLACDRERKLPLYARFRIAGVWLFDLTGRCLEIHREPAPEGYRNINRATRADTVAPLLLPAARLDLGPLLG